LHAAENIDARCEESRLCSFVPSRLIAGCTLLEDEDGRYDSPLKVFGGLIGKVLFSIKIQENSLSTFGCFQCTWSGVG